MNIPEWVNTKTGYSFGCSDGYGYGTGSGNGSGYGYGYGGGDVTGAGFGLLDKLDIV